MIQEAIHYSRMILGIHAYLRSRPVSDAEAVIRHQLENRETMFLDTVRRVIFNDPRNPYHEMFRLAGCTFEDLARAIARDGLEATLGVIQRQGVYLTHDEFKGKAPIARSGRQVPGGNASFRNPLVWGGMLGTSSGSRSAGTGAPESTKVQLYREARAQLCARELGLGGRVRIALKPILPSITGLNTCLQGSRLGQKAERWFTAGGDLHDSDHYRWATNCLVLISNLFGGKVPFPTYLPPNDFTPAAAWIAQRRVEGGACLVDAFTSSAVRVAAAALQKNLDIRGTLFLVGGEALTEAKRAVIGKTGAEVYPYYATSEMGLVGQACKQMRSGNRVHLFHDSLAAISYKQRAALSEVEVDALLFTTLLPFAPYVLINAEMGDSGIIEPAPCDCLFSRFGFKRQVRDISSYGKLTGQGVTLVGTDAIRILEEVLPARLGGAPGDYQLVEHEGRSQTQLTLRVSPRAGVCSTERIRECFLKEIRRCYGGSLAARMWGHAEGVDVVVAEPFSTITGKVLPLHLLASVERRSDAP